MTMLTKRSRFTENSELSRQPHSGALRAAPVIDLPDVTLVAVSGIALNATSSALSACLRHARFARALLLSDREPSAGLNPQIEWRPIRPIGSKAVYSRFMLKELADHIETSHALCVQWDGFIIDPAAWTSEFLQFDYIGAVWPQFDDGHDVGNGGFSLRSKRLLELARDIPYDGSTPEDVVIGREARDSLEAKGIRFAPRALAQRFAYERTPPTGAEFGFHGAFNLVKLLSRSEVFRLLQSLEPQVLTENEHKELARWAIRRGRAVIAGLLIVRILRQRAMRRSRPR